MFSPFQLAKEGKDSLRISLQTAIKMETPPASNPSTSTESEATVDCQLLLTTMAGNEVTVSTNIAQFDRFEDFEEHIVDYLATVSIGLYPPNHAGVSAGPSLGRSARE